MSHVRAWRKKFQVCWSEEGSRKSATFDSRSEAEAFARTVDARSASTGRARTRLQVLTDLADSFEIDAFGCWLWTKTIQENGYGVATWSPANGRRHNGAHRVVLAALEMPVPSDLTVDHLCRVRHCVNPDHLEVVDQRVNTLRGNAATAVNARKTHCNRGHEFSPENTRIYTRAGHQVRQCRTCARAASAAYTARRAGKQGVA